jgi:hypothetical protein
MYKPLTSVTFNHSRFEKLSSTEKSIEWFKCKTNPFYFIFNYVYIPEIGGLLKYEEPLMGGKIKRVVRSVMRYHKCLFMASRQLGKALYINTPILMASGEYKIINDLKINDIILDENKNPTNIIAITGTMYGHPCYKIGFSTNEVIICDEDHLWNILNNQIKTTKELYDSQYSSKYYVSKEIYIKYIFKSESVPVKCIQVQNKSGMFLCGKTNIPTHNSTISAALLEWACNFYPYTPATILNANKSFALENLEKVKFIHNNLPSALRTPLKYKGERKTTMEYKTNSIIRVFYPSPSTNAKTLARSLTSPILYVDECAFIPHMKDAYSSAQPTLSSARTQAAKNGYPFFLLLTSTPNGTVGTGQFFYELYSLAVDSDDIFDDDNLFNIHSDILVDNPERNGFVRTTFHWSEDSTKTPEWYNQQCRDLNFDKRSINQELDLVFVGSTNCIFDDDFLSSLKHIKPISIMQFSHATHLKLFTDVFDSGDFFLIGADTAKSLTGDFSAIEIFSYSEFIQIGEYFGRLGSLTKYSQVLMEIIQFFYKLVGDRIILCVENNSIGSSIIEDLENANDGFDYMQYLYTPSQLNNKLKEGNLIRVQKQPSQFGINTNSNTKSKMVSFLYDYLTKNPGCVKSSDLINQLNVIERGINGAIRAQSSFHDDIFMAAALCAYVKKLSSLEYEPLLGLSSFTQQKQQLNLYKSLISVNSPIGQNISQVYNEQEGGLEYINDIYEHDDIPNSDMFSVF